MNVGKVQNQEANVLYIKFEIIVDSGKVLKKGRGIILKEEKVKI